MICRLEGELDRALGSPEDARLGLAWPHERIDENGTPTSFRLYVPGTRRLMPQDDVPSLDTLLKIVRDKAPGERFELLKKINIQLFGDAEANNQLSARIPGQRWIAFETDIDSRRYCLHNGRWYLLNQEYASRLCKQAQAIFDRDPGITLPDWPAGKNEGQYNEIAAKAIDGLCLDKKLITSDLHRHGIEVCDILGRDGTLIHVKNLSSSAPASHLLAQALVSAESLLFDESAQQQFRAKVSQQGWDPALFPTRTSKVILGVARKDKEITAANLFTFTQVTLVRQDQALAQRGIEVAVAPIRRK